MEADTCLCEDVDCAMEHETLTLRAEGEDEDEDEEEEEEDDMNDVQEVTVRRKRTLRSCIRSRACTVCLYLFIVLLFLSSVVAIFVIGILIVAPYNHAYSFRTITCSPVHSVRDFLDMRCSCGKGCQSLSPCVRMTVRLYPESPGTHDESWTAVMYDNECLLQRQCSYYPACSNSKERNQESVKQYMQKYGTNGKNYTCLYNPRQVTEVIRTRRFDLRDVTQGMIWPILVLSISIGMLFLVLRYRGCTFL